MPTVTAVSPASGSATGGTPVTISGTNLTSIVGIEFGNTFAALSSLVYNAGGTITIASPGGTAGPVDVVVATTLGASVVSPADQFTYAGSTTTGPTVTGVSSTTVAGTYGPGTLIPITVTFNEAITVTGTGTPQLTLNDGAVANYASGSGTATLTFNYMVAADQNTPDLDYASTAALAPNGGTSRTWRQRGRAGLPATGTDGLAAKNIVSSARRRRSRRVLTGAARQHGKLRNGDDDSDRGDLQRSGHREGHAATDAQRRRPWSITPAAAARRH